VSFEGEFEGLDGTVAAAAGFGRDEEDEEVIGVAAHFLLTASSVAELAADALFVNSEICCDGGLAAGADVVVVVVEAQL